uniref:Putative DNA binding, helix-turn-helix domain containing protein n=1 Tax=viral metagenome TaxID=1070528 RepID=A0A6M3LRR7_9ZZZZ
MTNKILKLRKRLKLTQKELAEVLGVDAITVSRWEREEQKPSRLALRQIERLER